jgi:ubiquinone/menaquinone biosynthesis C-methylase UbiE
MMAEVVRVLKPGGMILVTVNKKEEIEILQNALERIGIRGGSIDNMDGKGIYDQWLYLGTK